MRQFFKFLFASFFGSLLALTIGLFFVFIMIGAIAAMVSSFGSDDKEVAVEKNSIFAPNMSKAIVEKASDNPLEYFDFESLEPTPPNTLSTFLDNIKKAKTDDYIKGIYLNLNLFMGGRAAQEEIRRALIDFKTSGKPIYAYADVYTQKTYYIASVADSIFMQPAGSFEFTGMSMEMMFFKGLFDKLDVEPRVIKHGKFKSAGETFDRKEMSEANELQMRELMASIYQHYLAQLAETTGLDSAQLRSIANELKIRKPEDAVKLGLVDKLIYKDEMMNKLMALTGDDSSEDLELIGNSKYARANKTIKFNEDKIAVVYAVGEIGMGNGDEKSIGSESLSKAIREARLDEDVKAIVLRVNSPGGSALASDIILREAELAAETKPFIVSMGDVAASGGYYISCKAHKIVAEANTITGSIGVIAMIPGTKNFFENKLGITFDRIKSSPYADLANPNRDMNIEEKAIILNMIDNIYVDFITHVAEGRGLDTGRVNALGQGRVWTGLQAKERGLVDEIGGLNKALAIAAEQAGLDDYNIKTFPKAKNPFEKFGAAFNTNIKAKLIESELGEDYKLYKRMQAIRSYDKPLMLMPIEGIY